MFIWNEEYENLILSLSCFLFFSLTNDCSPMKNCLKMPVLKGKKWSPSVYSYILSPPRFVPNGNEGGKERGLTKGLYFFPSNYPDKPVSQWISPCQLLNYIQSPSCRLDARCWQIETWKLAGGGGWGGGLKTGSFIELNGYVGLISTWLQLAGKGAVKQEHGS